MSNADNIDGNVAFTGRTFRNDEENDSSLSAVNFSLYNHLKKILYSL